MKTRLMTALVLPLLALTAAAPATQPATRPSASAIELLRPYVGHEFTIETKLGNGETLRARETWASGLADKYISCNVYVQKADGSGEYQRYQSFFADDNGKLQQVSLDFTGKVRVVHHEVKDNAMTETWTANGQTFRQTITLTSETEYGWKVWMQAPGSDTWVTLIDGVWKRKN